MKNYRFLVPAILVVMLLASIYTFYDKRADERHEVDNYLTEARRCREQGIFVDAEKNYLNAVDLLPAQELYAEIADFYNENNMSRKTRKWCELMLETFPEEPQSYQYMLQQYINKKDYIACFDLLDIMHKRKVVAPEVDALMKPLEYVFYIDKEYDDVSVFGGGYSAVKIDGGWAYVDMRGTQTTALDYEKAGPFSGDLAPVVDLNGEVYFIDPNGNKKKIVENVANIVELGLIENELFALFNGESWGFYHLDGTHVFGDFEKVSNIGNGLAAGMKNQQWHILDYNGNEPTGQTYSGVLFDEKNIIYRNERIFVRSGSGYQMIDVAGNTYGEVYTDAHLFADATLAAVKIGKKWGFVDKTGVIQIQPQYDDARSFSNGLAAVKVNNKWGFIDQQGQMVIEPLFNDAKDLSLGGTVFVNTGREWQLLVLYKYNH